MKKLRKGIGILLLTTVLFTQTNCIGSFRLFNSVLEWNQGATSSKFVDELIFLALWIVPVYELATFADIIIFNSIEFWTDSNPLAMNEGDVEIKIVKNKGNTYEITATKNKFNIKQLKGDNAGQEFALLYNVAETAWYLEAEGKNVKVGELKTDKLNKQIIKLYAPNKTLEVEASAQGVETAKNLIKEEYYSNGVSFALN